MYFTSAILKCTECVHLRNHQGPKNYTKAKSKKKADMKNKELKVASF